jgi:hypothetical protein
MSYRVNMRGMGDVDLAPQVDAMVAAGVDPETAYQMALTTQAPTASETNQPGQPVVNKVDPSAGNLYVGGVSTTTWLIGGVALLAGMVFLSMKGKR